MVAGGHYLKLHINNENDDSSRTIGWYLSNFVPECLIYKFVLIFLQFGIPRWPPFAVTNNSAEHENDNILITAKEFDQICVKIILAMSCFKCK